MCSQVIVDADCVASSSTSPDDDDDDDDDDDEVMLNVLRCQLTY